MAVTVAQLQGEISIQGASEAQSQLNSVDGAAKALQSSFSDGLTSGTEKASGGFFNFVNNIGNTIFSLKQIASTAISTASSLLQPAINAETMKTAFTTLMGSTKAATDEMAKLDAFASKTPFQTMDIDKAAAQLIGFGINAKDVIPDLTSIGDALSAVGRGSSADLDRIVGIFGKIQMQGKLTGQDMMQFSNDGINAWAILEQQTGKTQAQLQSMVSQGLFPADKAMQMLTEGIEKNPLYAGGMAKQSATFAGTLSTLKSNWDQFLASVGSPIMQGLTPILANAANILASSAFKNFASGVGQGIIGAFSGIGQAANYVGNVFKSLNLTEFNDAWKTVSTETEYVACKFGDLFSAASPLGGVLKQLGTDADPIAEVIGNLAKGALSTVTNALWGISSAFISVDSATQKGKGPIAEIGKELQDLGKDAQQVGSWFMSSVVPALKSVLPSFLDLGKTLVGTVGPAFIQIRGVVVDVMQHAFEKFAPIIEKIVPPCIRFAGVLAGDISNALKFIMPYVVQAAKAIGDFANGLIDRIAPIAKQVFDGISIDIKVFSAIWNTIWPGLSQVLKGVWDEIVGVIKIAWSIITGLINISLDIISGNWKGAWNDMLNMFKGIWDGIKTYFSGAVEIVKGLVKGLVDGVVGLFTGLWDKLTGHSIIPDMINDIVNCFQGLASDALKWGSDMIQGFVNGITSMIGSVEDAAKSVASKIAQFLHFSKPDMGPLVDVDNWMPDFGDVLAKGLHAQVGKIQMACSPDRPIHENEHSAIRSIHAFNIPLARWNAKHRHQRTAT